MTNLMLQDLDPNRAALLFVEFQREWIAEDGKLHNLLDVQHFPTMMNTSQTLIESARQLNLRIIHVGFKFSEGYAELGAARVGLNKLNKEYAAFSGVGGEFVEPFKPHPGEFEAVGRVGISAFSGSNLELYLRNQGIDTIFLTGFTLHACIESTLRDAHDRGYVSVIVEDATETFNPIWRDYIMQAVVPQFGISATTTQTLAFFEKATTPQQR